MQSGILKFNIKIITIQTNTFDIIQDVLASDLPQNTGTEGFKNKNSPATLVWSSARVWENWRSPGEQAEVISQPEISVVLSTEVLEFRQDLKVPSGFFIPLFT